MIKHTVKLVTVIVLLFFLYFIVVNFHDKKTTLDKEDSFTTQNINPLTLNSGWQRIAIKDVGYIDLPSNFAIESESDESTGSGARVISSSFKALPYDSTKYALIELATFYGSAGDYISLDLDLLALSKDEISSIEIIASNLSSSLKQNTETICHTLNYKLIAWQPLIPFNSNGMFGFNTLIVMEKSDTSLILQDIYCFPNYDRIHILNLTYPYSESNIWESDFRKISNSFRITQIRLKG